MAELLSREKELFKMNMELNMMAASPRDGASNYPAIKCGGVSLAKAATYILAEPRFGTYHKQKGPSTLLKKKAAGDAQVMTSPKQATAASATQRTWTRTTASQKQRGATASQVRHVAVASHAAAAASPAKEAAKEAPKANHSTETLTPTSAAVAALGAESPAKPSHYLTKSKTPDWNLRSNVGRVHGVPKDIASASAPRFESKFSTFTRGQVSKTSTYLKYRNPNFIESPSLEEILRSGDEDSQVLELEITQQRESTTVVNGTAKKQLTQDNFIKFLKAKVAILEEDHARLSQDMLTQKERLDQTLEAQRRGDTQRDQAMNTNKQLTEQLRKAEQQCEDANKRQKERQLESTSQQRELEQMKREMRLLKQTNTNLENRLTRTQEELESARQSLTKLRNEQREQQETTRQELESREKRIKALKRQRADLLNAYKKQLFMIDNLKRQTSCMEQSVAIGFGEKEFSKVLDWNTRS